MADLRFGDLVCYRLSSSHDDVCVYVGACNHDLGPDLIDLLVPDSVTRLIRNGFPRIELLEHKTADLWRPCEHLLDENGETVRHVRPKLGRRVLVDGVDITDSVKFFGMNAVALPGHYAGNPNIEIIDD